MSDPEQHAPPLATGGTEEWPRPSQSRSYAQLQLEQEIKESDDRAKERGLFHGSWFTKAIGIVIFCNTLQLAMAVDYRSPPFLHIWYVADRVFTIIFALEMLIKIAVLRREYFRHRWNIADFVVVCVSVLSLWVVTNANGAAKLSAVRSLRLLRLVRTVHFLSERRELVMLVEGIGASLGAMFWIGMLLAMIIFICAIMCTELIGHADYTDLEGDTLDNKDFFGNIERSTLTLLNIALMAEWGEVSRLLLNNQVYLVPPLLFFIFVTTLGVLNVIVGVIVDRTNEAANRLRSKEKKQLKIQKLEAVLNLSEWLQDDERLDSNASIDVATMQSLAADNDVLFSRCMECIDLPHGFSIEDLYVMLDRDGDGRLREHELIGGLTRLITNNDFHNMCQAQHSRSQTKQMIQSFRRETCEALVRIEKSIAWLCTNLQEQGHLKKTSHPDDVAKVRSQIVEADTCRSASSADMPDQSSALECDVVRTSLPWEPLPAEHRGIVHIQGAAERIHCPSRGGQTQIARETTTRQDDVSDDGAMATNDSASERVPRKLRAEAIHLTAPPEWQAKWSGSGSQRSGPSQVVHQCQQVQGDSAERTILQRSKQVQGDSAGPR